MVEYDTTNYIFFSNASEHDGHVNYLKWYFDRAGENKEEINPEFTFIHDWEYVYFSFRRRLY